MASRRTPAPPSDPPPRPIAEVIKQGDDRKSLEAMRDRLAEEANDVRWAKHKAECRCSCGIGDGRVLVAIMKEIRAINAEIGKLPPAEGGDPIDGIVASVTKLDGARRTRPTRRAGAAGSQGSAVR